MYKPVYFTDADFTKCVPSCFLSHMNEVLIQKLDIARHLAGIPFVLTSAYRCGEWEKSHGRTGTSSHTKGLAVDIRCSDSIKRMCIVRALIQAGFFRIGIAKNFIHADIDSSKPACIWLY